MSEQLALEQGFRQRSTVDHYKFGLRAPAVCVDGPSDELFARPAFAQNEDRRIDSGDARKLLVNLNHPWACPHNFRMRQFLCEFSADCGRVDECEFLFNPFEDLQHVVDREWFADVVEGTVMD